MTVKELVLDHLTHTFEKEAWQPAYPWYFAL